MLNNAFRHVAQTLGMTTAEVVFRYLAHANQIIHGDALAAAAPWFRSGILRDYINNVNEDYYHSEDNELRSWVALRGAKLTKSQYEFLTKTDRTVYNQSTNTRDGRRLYQGVPLMRYLPYAKVIAFEQKFDLGGARPIIDPAMEKCVGHQRDIKEQVEKLARRLLSPENRSLLFWPPPRRPDHHLLLFVYHGDGAAKGASPFSGFSLHCLNLRHLAQSPDGSVLITLIFTEGLFYYSICFFPLLIIYYSFQKQVELFELQWWRMERQ